jgi:hypothetical protein
MKLLQRQMDSKLTFNSLKEIDVAFVKQQIHEAILIDEKIVKARRRKKYNSALFLKSRVILLINSVLSLKFSPW